MISDLFYKEACKIPKEEDIFTIHQMIESRKKRLEIMKQINRKQETELENEIKELQKRLVE